MFVFQLSSLHMIDWRQSSFDCQFPLLSSFFFPLRISFPSPLLLCPCPLSSFPSSVFPPLPRPPVALLTGGLSRLTWVSLTSVLACLTTKISSFPIYIDTFNLGNPSSSTRSAFGPNTPSRGRKPTPKTDASPSKISKTRGIAASPGSTRSFKRLVGCCCCYYSEWGGMYLMLLCSLRGVVPAGNSLGG